MVVGDAPQHQAKRRFVIDALTRIGRFPGDVPVDDVVEAPPALGYRNKIELTFGRIGTSGPVVGYHRAGRPSDLVDVSHCAIAEPRLSPLLSAARSFFLLGPGASDPAVLETREPLRLVLRSSGARDERLIAFRGLEGPFPTLGEFARQAAIADPGLVGVVRLIASPGRRGGARVDTTFGRSWLEDEFHGSVFRVPAATFLQVHRGAAEALGNHVLERAGTPRDVLELYGGIGALGLALARAGARATIVDADPAALACGEEAARSHGLATVTFARADVHEFLRRRGAETTPDLVIADPPRTGLGKGVAERIARLKAPRIAMVSCDPATLARDLSAFADRGYALSKVTPFDLFPQTAHVEAVAWLDLRA
jgi:23S rRNA (uracil1939-C5)-methyltransferase